MDDDGSLQQAFIASVAHLSAEKKLASACSWRWTNTVAKKGGDGIGYPATSTRRGEVIAITTTMAMYLSPLPVAPVNETDMVLLPRVYKP